MKIEFKRVPAELLVGFDPNSKRCTMNCGPCLGDPRTDKERKFLCSDCETLDVLVSTDLDSNK